MVDVTDVKEFLERLSDQAESLITFVQRVDVESKLLLYFSLGAMSDQYTAMSEELLRQKKTAEASYYTGKAVVVRRLAHDLFKEVPEKDYYTNMFNLPKGMGKIDDALIAELHQVAQFCVEKVEPDKGIMENAGDMYPKVRDYLRSIKARGILDSFRDILVAAAREYKDKPHKLESVYELGLLVENVATILKVLKEEESEAGGLPGFGV